MRRKIKWENRKSVVFKAAGSALFSLETTDTLTAAVKEFAAAVFGADEIIILGYGHSNDHWGGEFRAHRSLTTYKLGPAGWYCDSRTTRTV